MKIHGNYQALLVGYYYHNQSPQDPQIHELSRIKVRTAISQVASLATDLADVAFDFDS
jgi:hypothetical protein